MIMQRVESGLCEEVLGWQVVGVKATRREADWKKTQQRKQKQKGVGSPKRVKAAPPQPAPASQQASLPLRKAGFMTWHPQFLRVQACLGRGMRWNIFASLPFGWKPKDQRWSRHLLRIFSLVLKKVRVRPRQAGLELRSGKPWEISVSKLLATDIQWLRFGPNLNWSTPKELTAYIGFVN